MGTDTQEHLGGFTPGGDPATFYPELWAWLVRDLAVRSVIDVGCGEGQALHFFAKEIAAVEKSAQRRVLGIDGIQQEDPNIVQHDYAEGPFVPPEPIYDLCWCCEFVEHVEDKFVPNFLATFEHADLLLMTHAEPGQLGHHHVNCRPAYYWIARLAGCGFKLESELTETTRVLAAANSNPYNHYVRSGLAFRRA